MSLLFQIEIIIVALFFISLVLKLIRKDQLETIESLLWVLASLVLIICAIVPSVPIRIAHLLGFEVASNFLYFLMNVFFAVYIFIMRIQNYKQKDIIRLLVQEVSLLNKEQNDMKGNEEDAKK